jgi:sugar phosphate isomerase/epimerase
MDVGIVHFMAYPECMNGAGPVAETMKKICEDEYFAAVEVTHVADDAERKGAIEATRAAEMKVSFGAEPILLGGDYDLNALDPERRRAAVDRMRMALPEAAEWRPQHFAVLSGRTVAQDDMREAKAMLMGSLKEICERSRRGPKLPIHLQTFDRLPFGKNRLIGPTDEAVEIADQVEPYFPGFGLCLDLSHLPLLDESPESALKTAAPYLRSVHIGNCAMKDPDHPAYGDEHPLFGADGGETGIDELAAFLKVLIDLGYLGEGKHNNVTIAVKPFGEQTSEDVLDGSKQALDAAWAAL